MKKLLFTLLTVVFVFSAEAQTQAEIIPTNDYQLHEILKDFNQSARYYKVEHIPEFKYVDKVYFIKADLNMLGMIAEDGKAIVLNEELKLYPYLLRIILFRQIGKIYGVKPDTQRRHNIMSEHWEIDLQHELYARHLSRRSWHDEYFFTSLAEKHPIEKRL